MLVKVAMHTAQWLRGERGTMSVKVAMYADTKAGMPSRC